MKKALKFSTIIALLALTGCAQMPATEPVAPAAEPFEALVPSGITFSVHGKPQGGAECLARYSMGYTSSIQPVELSLSLETEMKREGGEWMVTGWTEGILEQVPTAVSSETPDGGFTYDLHQDELLLGCDQLRTRVIVLGCNPAPCPNLSIDDRNNAFELVLDDRSAR